MDWNQVLNKELTHTKTHNIMNEYAIYAIDVDLWIAVLCVCVHCGNCHTCTWCDGHNNWMCNAVDLDTT